MRPLDGYPTSWGSSRASVVPHAGPGSYTQIVSGVAPALASGGDTIEAISAGLKFIDFCVGGLTDSGVYRVECIPGAQSGVIGSNNPNAGQPSITYTLRWVVVATGAEAAALLDLSDEIVRLLVVGPK